VKQRNREKEKKRKREKEEKTAAPGIIPALFSCVTYVIGDLERGS
jgi:hypothetical protein